MVTFCTPPRVLSWRSTANVGACIGPAMAGTWLETAAHVVDHVIPPVPVRSGCSLFPSDSRASSPTAPPRDPVVQTVAPIRPR